jgi:hypothetical protein
LGLTSRMTRVPRLSALLEVYTRLHWHNLMVKQLISVLYFSTYVFYVQDYSRISD